MLLPAVLLSLVVAAGPAALAAQEPADDPSIDTPYRWVDRGFRVNLSAGYLSTGTTPLDLGPASSAMASGGLRARITDPISVEARLSFGDTDRPVVDPRLAGGPAAVDSMPVRWAVLEGGLQLALTGARTWHGLQPYVSLGAGILVGLDEPASPVLAASQDTAPGDLRFEINTAPVATAAGGVEWHLSDALGVSLEARDHLWRLTTPRGFFRDEILDRIEDSEGVAPSERNWVHNLELSLGLWYYP